jgi:hypothetical protein
VSVDMEPQGETSTCSAGTGFNVILMRGCVQGFFAKGEEIIKNEQVPATQWQLYLGGSLKQ